MRFPDITDLKSRKFQLKKHAYIIINHENMNQYRDFLVDTASYNYYYVILRNKHLGGDTTSRVFEVKTPSALKGESQKHVDTLFKIYRLLYGGFDKAIYILDHNAHKAKALPTWFMSALSIYGLGFQLLLIGVLLIFGLKSFIIPIFISLTGFIIVFIGIKIRFI